MNETKKEIPKNLIIVTKQDITGLILYLHMQQRCVQYICNNLKCEKFDYTKLLKLSHAIHMTLFRALIDNIVSTEQTKYGGNFCMTHLHLYIWYYT